MAVSCSINRVGTPIMQFVYSIQGKLCLCSSSMNRCEETLPSSPILGPGRRGSTVYRIRSIAGAVNSALDPLFRHPRFLQVN